ncbi:MAG: GNAT family N-acetyltransferase [Candidatus Omnitrophica bacterium]|nr:GNAT family N-acetyltransferase [Candidatus Omnitrophota bacterium]
MSAEIPATHTFSAAPASRGDSIRIRPFAPSDAAAVKALITGILASEFPGESEAFPPTDLQQLAVAYGGPKETCLVAEVGGRIVGACAVKQDGPSAALLRRLFVAPTYRGQRLGSRLVESAVAFCRAQRYRKITIRTSDRMATAMAICRRQGFQQQARMPLGAVHLVHLTLRLS